MSNPRHHSRKIPEWLCSQWAAYSRQLRRYLRLTRRQLAQQIEIDPSYITLWESPTYGPPARHIVERIAEQCGEPMVTLLAAGMTPDLTTTRPSDWQAAIARLKRSLEVAHQTELAGARLHSGAAAAYRTRRKLGLMRGRSGVAHG